MFVKLAVWHDKSLTLISLDIIFVLVIVVALMSFIVVLLIVTLEFEPPIFIYDASVPKFTMFIGFGIK